MDIDVVFADYSINDISKLSLIAEEVGFNCIWTSETKHNPFLPLSIASQNTSKIKLGTAISVALARSPMVLAYTSWDLSQLSNGRFFLGLGTQVGAHVKRRFGMPWNSPVAQLKEIISCIRHIWNCWQTQSPLDFNGKYYKLNLMTPFFNPGPIEYPDIPIYIAGVNEALCKTAGKLCDGFHVHPLHTEQYIQDLITPNIKLGCESTNRNIKDVSLSGSVFVITGPDSDSMTKTKEFVRSQIAFYSSTPTYSKVLEMHGWGEIANQLNKLSSSGNFRDMPKLITDEILENIAIIGEPHEIAPLALKKYSGLLDRINFYLPFDTDMSPEMSYWWKNTIRTIQS